MKLRGYAIKRAALAFTASVLLLSMSAIAQEMRSEISVQGTGFFTKDSDGNQATQSGGFLVGYRYNINRWFGAEADYGYTRNTQLFTGFLPARVQANVHQITGAVVVKLPGFHRVLPYVLGGGGALIFHPTNNLGGTFAGASSEAQGTFLYGGGADYVFSRRLALRVEYRGYVYQVPDFNVASLHTDSWTHTAQPSAGFVFRF